MKKQIILFSLISISSTVMPSTRPITPKQQPNQSTENFADSEDMYKYASAMMRYLAVCEIKGQSIFSSTDRQPTAQEDADGTLSVKIKELIIKRKTEEMQKRVQPAQVTHQEPKELLNRKVSESSCC
jgi:hypothetical protein